MNPPRETFRQGRRGQFLLLCPDSPGRRAADFRQVRDIFEVGTFGRVVADEALFLAHRRKLLPVLGMSPLRAMAGLTLDVLQHIREAGDLPEPRRVAGKAGHVRGFVILN